ncbi:repressor LexA [Clostridium thermosuccinogenes]|jgi:repressor LexA|uniref:LexA repressor n=1 Tax=Clostridium thermosuccinogenes TaxID=84032 RepID=A0A2K2FMK3_9CLOT|nr:transcriptional repressor LexA [Pseudoclostridium thermosuccinogenes]AUS96556.1 repressor LexA [Pseudoclostridium thermosuccinogenes]PNT92784.1 repressor LexA [Pseudoclostridium thermosuccinogenes]PNT97992.1 repressor LexA [Pseudoclostridium thermosuccinogenes]PNU00012.1 repressor LexA [Pseudoclostridium thermosuccinogenes]
MQKDNKSPLNEKQRKILEFLRQQIDEKGYPPSVREICSAMGYKSTSTVHGYIEQLQKNGYLQKDPTKPRALKIISNNKETEVRKEGEYYSKKELVDVPIVGKVTAGQPILAVENIEDTFPIPVDFVQNSTAFMLRVQGDSMVEAGILDKDYVLVKQQSVASNGDIVVALIGDEATVKTFYKEKDYIRLQPQNKYYDPIIVKEGVSILGKVIGVFRKL